MQNKMFLCYQKNILGQTIKQKKDGCKLSIKFCLKPKQALISALNPKTWLTALIGFSIMEGFFRFAPKIRLDRIDLFTLNGTYFLPPGRKASFLGAIMFYGGAVGWVSLHKSFSLKWNRSSIIKPLTFGTMVFLFASVIVMPITGWVNPYVRRGIIKKPGFMGLQLAGWRTPMSNFLAHIIFSLIVWKLEEK
jgi:uncharacterized membrane protein YagU involved in acid resistance